MIRSLYTAVSGMITQEAKQDVITNNLANVNTVGFKNDGVVTKSFDEVLLYNYDKKVNGKNFRQNLGNLSFGSRIDDVNTNFTQGIIEKTDKSTDFSIMGRGFFTVVRDDGINTERLYTRDGHFHTNKMGYLVNDSGNNVLGRNIQNGRVEPIRINGGKITVDDMGNIKENDVLKYKLYTVDFPGDNSYSNLKKVGDNLYIGGNPEENNNVVVNQYALERSNVNVTKEIIDMITVMRTFETNQKVIQTIDETLGKAANEVGSIR
ncbi:flagellar hook-basal body complex protein [Clostridium rectalis]|uniref:flagellar hook-basal body complex protein n=1 Tax=Clostridium rectalis TaxID=2040295 RepID=UPI000F63B3D5|nr:flagellar hook-basal body complex protein [Clostridium rectalis]